MPDDRKTLAAFWELYLHESFRLAGFRIECHPRLPGASTRPDFKISNEDGCAYVEARLVGKSDAEVKVERREAQLRDALDKTKSPDFILNLTLAAAGATSPPGKRIRATVEGWLDSLDADALMDDYVRDFGTAPSRTFEVDGWTFDIEAHPCRPERRGSDRRALGVYGPSAVSLVETGAEIRERLHYKAGRYGVLDAPLIPALLVSRTFANEEHVVDALFGSECVRLQVHPREGIVSAEPDRQRDGVWTTPLDRSGKLVPGVIVALKLGPWNIGARAPVFWRNPLPDVGLPFALPWAQRRVADDGTLSREDDFSAGEFFGVSGAWPECEA